MSNQPTVRRITDMSFNDNRERRAVRSALDHNASLAESCKVCPKPLWFTAFFDGTGNNYSKDGGSSNVIDATSPLAKYSNIAKLWKFAHVDNKINPLPRTLTEYIEGVGTPCAKVGDSGEGWDRAIGMAAAGWGEARIRWMLKQLDDFVKKTMPFVSQINLAVFGFSRGATEARAFVRMLAGEGDSLAFRMGEYGDKLIWRQPGLDGKSIEVVVYFMGLFDTVSSVGFGGSRLEKYAPSIVQGAASVFIPIFGTPIGFVANGMLRAIDKGGHAEWAKDLRIPSHVRKCVHYIAGHEVREKFPSDSVRDDQAVPSNCIELVYPGMHSDIGGGYNYRDQENRSNELALIPLNNMYIEAWKAGVPLKSPAEVMATSGSLFAISKELEDSWNVYMGQGDKSASLSGAPTTDKLESLIIWHMNHYYLWRASRSRRLRDGRLKPVGGVDSYMAITDKQWNEDALDVAKSETGWLRSSTSLHQKSIYSAYKGEVMKQMDMGVRQQFDHFFDFYVHDSIAGFKNQMTDAGIGPTERSRWTINRQIFMGKREDKFLCWRYEGDKPETAGTKTAVLKNVVAPMEADVLV